MTTSEHGKFVEECEPLKVGYAKSRAVQQHISKGLVGMSGLLYRRGEENFVVLDATSLI